LQQNRSTLYATSEQFTNEFVSAINSRTMRQFRDRYRNLDLLLLDDVQFLIGKEQTQESLFHTFNDLHQAGAQIVLASDRAPQSIHPLEDRLRSRFQCGLLADIQPPSLETRIAILHAWAATRDQSTPDEILELIAHRISGNVRILRGAFNRVFAMSDLMKMPMTPERVTHQLDAIVGPENRRELTPEQVLNQVALHYGITTEQIISRSRTAIVSEARQVGMYLLTTDLGMTPTNAGRFLGGRNHSTVIHGAGKIRNAIANNERVGIAVVSIKARLNE
jgi:chromosomal replication initiator protein